MTNTGPQLAPEFTPRDPAPSAPGPVPPGPAPLIVPPDPQVPAAGASPAAVSSSLPSVADVPPDLRTPLGWRDLALLAVFYASTGAVLTLLVAAGAFLAFGVSPAALQKSVAARALVVIVSQGLLSGLTLLFLYILLRGRTGDPFWPSMGWRPFTGVASWMAAAAQYVFGGFGLAVLVGLLSRFVGDNSPVPMEELFRSRQSVVLLMALGILVAPLVEETVFRGCLYPVVARKFGWRAGVVVTGALFGLAHAQQLWGGWGQIALLIGVGLLLTYVRAQARTVAASYLVHLGYNTTLFAGFYFATSGLQHIPS